MNFGELWEYFWTGSTSCICLQSKDYYFTGCWILSGHVYIHQAFSNSKWKINRARCSSEVWNRRKREREREIGVSSVMRFIGFVHCMLTGRFGCLEGLACWSLTGGLPKRQHYSKSLFPKLYPLQFFMYVCGDACFFPVCHIWTKCRCIIPSRCIDAGVLWNRYGLW